MVPISLRNILFLGILMLGTGCMDGNLASPDYTENPQDPGYPRVESILPLGSNYHWEYLDTIYHSTNGRTYPKQTITLTMNRIFGRRNDSVYLLEPYFYNDTTPLPDDTLFSYAWMDKDSGVLLSHYDIPPQTPGVYVVGTFEGDRGSLFDSMQLWLPYPVEKGFQWQYKPTTASVPEEMEVVSTNAPLYFHNHSWAQYTPLTFVNCYIYKATIGTTTRFYYYNPQYGAVAFLKYEDDRLVRSYSLTNFNRYSYNLNYY